MSCVWNLVQYQRLKKNSNFRKCKMSDGRHITNRKIVISQRKKSSDFDEIWYTKSQMQIWNSMTDGHAIKYFFLIKMADGRHIKNRFWPQISSRFPVSMKFCVMKQFFNIILVTGQIPAFHRTHFCFPNVVWGIGRAALFVSSPTHLFYCHFEDKLN